MLFQKKQTPNHLKSNAMNKQISIGPLTLRFITIIIVAALCILYLAQSTQGATQNYKLRELEQHKQELEKENERLDVEAVRLKALKNVDVNKDKKEEEKEFESIDTQEYIQ